ncbi:hypothetical protein SLEP1_g53276 [Rubroshorea leprosula]|uniref:Uncharacterized protein n=1 Tax=Rubroshorea leprosula TaxID=152421 RepID=A0AAV5MBA8_9ROSI|nr:hypothetical protein SLEP1_g53276 [Rubroshorea leprosula]
MAGKQQNVDYNIVDGKLRGRRVGSETQTVTVEDSTRSKITISTENRSVRDTPLAEPEANHPRNQKYDSKGSEHRTTDINRGPGAAARNKGIASGSINDRIGEINFGKSSKEEIEWSLQTGGNINIGIAPGADNEGEKSGSINGGTGAINI